MKTTLAVVLALLLLSINIGAAIRTSADPRNVFAKVERGGDVFKDNPPISTGELRITDAEGRTRMLLTAKSGTPTLQLLRDNGALGLVVALDSDGRGSMRIQNPNAEGPTAAIEIDDKGAHVKFDGPTGASCYFFLNNEQESGVVFIDAHGTRRVNILADANGNSKIERLDESGHPIP